MPVDIFIKTYHKDFIWLEYLLKSIKKFASGFRNIAIVSDDDGYILPDHFKEIINFTITYVKVPVVSINMDHGTGYSWQQYMKLSWYKYTDAESIVIFDSDEMLTCPTSPDSFKTNGKYNWFYREWKDAGSAICHKKTVDMILNFDTKYESMWITGFYFTLSATRKLEEYLNSIHGTSDVWNIIILLRISGLSEFNIFGNFIHKIQDPEYNYLYDTTGAFNSTIIKSWSWGGMNTDDRIRREKILNL
jgi:hypothetical protein